MSLSADPTGRLSGVRRFALLAMLLTLALILGIVERAIPMDVMIPGVRLGLPNALILLALYLFSFRDALVLVVLKCVMTALLAGTFVSFFYSISGSLLSFFVMFGSLRLARARVSPVGVSITGAVFHNLGQLLAACAVLGSVYVFSYLPVLLVSGAVTGLLVGLAVKYTMPYARRHVRPGRPPAEGAPKEGPPKEEENKMRNGS
ncbi:MAG: Gx transporter family protein [Oscillospiraceae bacterium]|jgi:heptaprenyl diphosphate synthase|nr:Gx transporter family protein [Oscillospiraceae bacterium]